jgi:hypothetical protein
MKAGDKEFNKLVKQMIKGFETVVKGSPKAASDIRKMTPREFVRIVKSVWGVEVSEDLSGFEIKQIQEELATQFDEAQKTTAQALAFLDQLQVKYRPKTKGTKR